MILTLNYGKINGKYEILQAVTSIAIFYLISMLFSLKKANSILRKNLMNSALQYEN